MNKEVESELKKSRIDFVRLVDISRLADKQNRGLPCAMLIGTATNPKFAKDVFSNPDYRPVFEDEYIKTENRVGEVTGGLAEFLAGKGCKALSQSDARPLAEDVLNFETEESVLPHKMIVQLSELGWIGKNNLFATPEYGAAQCLSAVLTDTPLETIPYAPISPRYGNCNTCRDICEKKVLKGTTWDTAISRDDIIDVYGCSIYLKCLVHCLWTQKYVNSRSGFLQPQKNQPDYFIYRLG